MWLINVETLQLEEHPSYADSSRPRYSILSHRWGDGEVSHEDMQGEALRCTRPGWRKIVKCCEQSRKDNIPYTWIDTCCIDKTSTAELSEAINSMFRWYRDAEICYAYLADYEPDSIGDSVWFTRGWTLQELVAPRELIFFDGAWEPLGGRRELSGKIAKCTDISQELLEGRRGVESFSIAQRMSWAGTRQTTKPEDVAYSLLGIFDVNMPLLYGEGAERAFRRLQDELIKQSDDHSIFAWSLALDPGNYGLLARSPRAFAESEVLSDVAVRKGQASYALTNRGLSITLPMVPYYTNIYLALLNCRREYQPSAFDDYHGRCWLGIFLHRLGEDDAFVRINWEGMDFLDCWEDEIGDEYHREFLCKLRSLSINVRQRTLTAAHRELIKPQLYGFRIATKLLGDPEVVNGDSVRWSSVVWPAWNISWDPKNRMIRRHAECSDQQNFADIDLSPLKLKIKRMRLHIDFDFNPVIFLAELSALENKIGHADPLSPDGQKMPQPRDGLQPFYEHNAEDIARWNLISEVSVTESWKDHEDIPFNDRIDFPLAKQSLAHKHTSREGLWLLKGDRIDGLDVILEDLEGDEGDEEDEDWQWGARLTVYRVKTAEGDIWEVDIRNLAREE